MSDTPVHHDDAGTAITRLLSIMSRLRDPERGCPWDIEQDYRSIAPHTLEEAYEVVEAIESGDADSLESELGDLLLQVVFLSQIAVEKGDFDFRSVTTRLSEKLIDRHPHVFGDRSDIRSADDMKEFWERRKQEERGNVGTIDAMEGICTALPALTRAGKVQRMAARLGYEFGGLDELIGKFNEELGEFGEAHSSNDRKAMEAEIGDLIFTAVNLARVMDIDPEQVLRGATGKFVKRFRSVERRLEAEGRSYAGLSHSERDELWESAKSG